jgi:nicotinamidase-related amidase
MDRFNGLDIPESLADALTPSALALLVYDMQVGILRQIADADRVLANVQRILAVARERRVRTVFLRHYFMPTELAGVFQLRQAKVWQNKERASETRSLIPHGSPGFELVPEMEPRAGEAVMDKITMSAFEGTPLDIVLRDCGVRAYLIVGVALEVGVEPTVRHSADLGYVPVVVRDACGAGDAAAGERALASLEFAGDAIVADTEE